MKQFKRLALSGSLAYSEALRQITPSVLVSYHQSHRDNPVKFFTNFLEDGSAGTVLQISDSPLSALSFAIGAGRTGGRVALSFEAEGLAQAQTLMREAVKLRLPLVVNATYATDNPPYYHLVNQGFLEFYCTSAQEVYTANLVATRLVEDSAIRLPIVIYYDKYLIGSFVENVNVLSDESVVKFIGGINYTTEFSSISSFASIWEAQSKVFEKFTVYSKALSDFSAIVLSPFDYYGDPDADCAVVLIGPLSGTLLSAVDEVVRERAKKIKVIVLKLIHPFPDEPIKKFLGSAKSIGLIESELLPLGRSSFYNSFAGSLYRYETSGNLKSLVLPIGREIVIGDFVNLISKLN